MFIPTLLFGLLGCLRPVVSGTIVDHEGKPAAAVKVEVVGTTLTALTDEKGAYALPYVPGAVRIAVTKDGYLPVTRAYDIAESTTFPASRMTLFPYVPGATFTWLGAGTAEALAGVTLTRNADAGVSGLPSVPTMRVPADVWGLVCVPQGESADGDEVATLLAGLAARTGGGGDPGAELYRMTWKESEVVNNWGRRTTLPVRMWVGGPRVEAKVEPSDALSPAGWILRPSASLEDGVYALSLRGSKRMWPFVVGEVANPLPVVAEEEGD